MAILKSRAKALWTRVTTLRIIVRLALLLLAVARLTACFNPTQPGCAFSCAGDGLCPSGYSCGTDLICHRDDGQGTCAILTDAGSDTTSDAATPDASSDATSGQ